jgi:hypothetical protein
MKNNLYLLTQNKKIHIYKKMRNLKNKVLSGFNAKIQAHVATREKVPKNDQKVGKII